jgi:hypothetical protein
MPEVVCANASSYETLMNNPWGELLSPDKDLGILPRGREYLNIIPDNGAIAITKIGHLGYDDNVKCSTIMLPLEMAYQLRDFLNKNLDDYAWRLAENGFLNEKRCSVLAKFKKVYYEDEIKNLNKSEETTDNKTEEAEVS